jgi:hypothetical protein
MMRKSVSTVAGIADPVQRAVVADALLWEDRDNRPQWRQMRRAAITEALRAGRADELAAGLSVRPGDLPLLAS